MAKLTRNIAGRISESKMIKAFRSLLSTILQVLMQLDRLLLKYMQFVRYLINMYLKSDLRNPEWH